MKNVLIDTEKVVEMMNELDDAQIYEVHKEYIDASGEYDYVIYDNMDSFPEYAFNYIPLEKMLQAVADCVGEGYRFNTSDEFILVDKSGEELKLRTSNKAWDLIGLGDLQEMAEYFIENQDEMHLTKEYLKF